MTEYPLPYPENYFKEFFLDDQGRMWFGSPPNYKVGYFILPNGNGRQTGLTISSYQNRATS